ncbi:transient receptor potential cation channel subfamily A member 1b [Osmerus mordax]|uniref:transient receptor potential cation channel subfamily A member 1b n=1 Tax=Osmerus mordax TaxID=8014 RepID=UPI00350F7F8D
MHFSREVLRQNSSYRCVIDQDDTAMASLNIFQLASNGDLGLLESLVRKDPWVLRERDDAGASPLHHASAWGHVRALHFITSATDQKELNSCDVDGNVPLHWAVQRNQSGSCAVLLELGADPNVLNTALMSPLHLAISHGHNSLLELLLSNKSTDANLEGDLGNTPLMLACSVNNCEALNMLLKHGARMCHQNKLGHFAIHAAAFSGAREAMDIILKAGEDFDHPVEKHINYLDKSKSSPLHLAVHGGNIEVIRFCISKGAKIDHQQVDKSTALHFACTQGAIEAVKLMLCSYSRVDDIINLPDGAFQTPLHRATIFDHKDLAEYLLSKGADINSIDCKGHTPLLLATSCGAWKTVSLLLSHGADVNIKDRSGCNFLHLAILQPKALRNLTQEMLQHSIIKDLLSDEDHEGCTPLHYACRLGIPDSVRNMLGLSGQVCLERKSKDKKSALHFAAQFGRFNTCERLLETIKDSRLLNEGDERGLTPLHLAAGAGHTKVVELLLRKGALFHSDYKGWTCLHHAAAEGYTQTMNILLTSNIKLLDKVDEDGSTALHMAAKEGHVAAVKLLLGRGAELTLNMDHASFLHEAIQHGKKEVVNTIIDSDRCAEAITLFKHGTGQRCAVLDMIEFLPESYEHLLDSCVTESDDDANSLDYHIEYNFRWLQAPLVLKKHSKHDKSLHVQPLSALNSMVQFNRIELLSHSVCEKYLEMKWLAYGSKAHILNLFVYLLGLLPLTHLIITLRPTLSFPGPGNQTSVNMVPISFMEQSVSRSLCMVMVLLMNIHGIVKEVVQISQQRMSYFKDASNALDWGAAVFSLLFIIPLFFNSSGTLHWEAGACAILLAWVNFLLYLQRFGHFGIYVVMFGEIMKTLVCIIVLFFFLMLAFGLGFYAIMLNQSEFSRLDLSVLQTFVMMVGELNYQGNFLNAYLNNELPFPLLTFIIFVHFVLLMPILLMNLLIGLAVGDIAEVQRNAALKRIAMQIELHTNLEEKLPYWFMKHVDKPSITVYPNRKCSTVLFNMGETTKRRTRLHLQNSRDLTPLENEQQKQKYRMKEMSCVLEKQHSLLKLIIQKMDITSEADDYDGPKTVKDERQKSKRNPNKGSKWVPLMKAIEARK